MSAKQRLTGKTRGFAEGQLDWLVEWGEPTEIDDGMIRGSTRRRRVAKRVQVPKQHGGGGHQEHEDQQNSGVDQKAR